MSTLINLNKASKERARGAQKAKAEENTIAFGRTKAEKDKDKAEILKGARHLDGHQREP